MRSLVNWLIVKKGRTVAVLYVNDSRPRDWSAEDCAFLADAANRTRTAPERRHAENEARETASFMRSVLATSTDCLKVLELDGRLSFMSEGGIDVIEISDFNAVRGCPRPDFLKDAGSQLARDAIEAAKRGETRHFEAAADTYIDTPKHWSVPGGRVEVRWAVRRTADEDVLHLRWAERGGPPAAEPTRRGFSSRIIRMGLSGAGGVELRYGAEGLAMEASAPLYQIQEA